MKDTFVGVIKMVSEMNTGCGHCIPSANYYNSFGPMKYWSALVNMMIIGRLLAVQLVEMIGTSKRTRYTT